MRSNNMILPSNETCCVAVIGMGYVGLPLAVSISLSSKSFLNSQKLNRKVVGFDINKQRLKELKQKFDRTGEISKEDLLKQLQNKTPISCKDVTFRFFGLSLATINTVISVSYTHLTLPTNREV